MVAPLLKELRTQKVGLGCMGLGGRFQKDSCRDREVLTLIHRAFDLGIKLFDTAEVYGNGYSEELLGKACKDNRQDYFIATKFSAEHAGANDLQVACERSLQRLKTDYIDLYQCHWPNPNIPLCETIAGLEELKREGKIRYFGFCNLNKQQLSSVLDISQYGQEVTLQQEYSLYERSSEYTVMPLCEKNDSLFIAYSPLGQGNKPHSLIQDELLCDLALKYGVSVYAVMLAWVAYKKNVLAIPMTSNIQHLEDNVKASAVCLSEEDYMLLANVFEQDIRMLDTESIEVVDAHTGKMYRSLQEALDNKLGLCPAPDVLAKDLREGDPLKPIKVRESLNKPGCYELYEGQLRYWAWVIAHQHRKPILAHVVRE